MSRHRVVKALFSDASELENEEDAEWQATRIENTQRGLLQSTNPFREEEEEEKKEESNKVIQNLFKNSKVETGLKRQQTYRKVKKKSTRYLNKESLSRDQSISTQKREESVKQDVMRQKSGILEAFKRGLSLDYFSQATGEQGQNLENFQSNRRATKKIMQRKRQFQEEEGPDHLDEEEDDEEEMEEEGEEEEKEDDFRVTFKGYQDNNLPEEKSFESAEEEEQPEVQQETKTPLEKPEEEKEEAKDLKEQLKEIQYDVPDDTEVIEELMEAKNIEQEKPLFSVFFSVVFLTFFLLVMQMSDCYYIKLAIEKLLTESLGEDENLELHEIREHSEVIDFYRKAIDRLYLEEPVELGGREVYANLINHEIYFGYMRINNNFADMEDCSSKCQEVFSAKRQKLFHRYEPKHFTNVREKPLPDGTTYHYHHGFDDQGGFIKDFKGSLSKQEVKAEFEKMIENGWFEKNSLLASGVELIFYNKNSEIGAIWSCQFLFENTGFVQVRTKTKPFMPEIILNEERYVVLACLLFIFFICVLTQTIKLLVVIISGINEFVKTRSLAIYWYHYIDLVTLTMCIAVVILWIEIAFSFFAKFKLPIGKDQFDYVEEVVQKQVICVEISSFAIILMSIRSLRVLTASFPAFGVLFDTIQKAKENFLALFFVLIVLSQVTVVICNIFFGSQEQSFAFIPYAEMTLFKMILGDLNYQNMEKANSRVAMIIYFPFVILFNIFILDVFASIVMRTYDNMRVKKQIVTEAMASIIAEETRNKKEVLLDFLLCRITMRQYQNDQTKPSMERQVTQEQNSSKPEMKAIFYHNFGQVKKLFHGTLEDTREQIEKDLRRKKVKIIDRRKKKLLKRKQLFEGQADHSAYKKLRESFFYAIYILIYVSLIILETKNYYTSQPQKFLHKFVEKQLFKDEFGHELHFKDIERVQDVLYFIEQDVFDIVYDPTDHIPANTVVGHPKMRLTLRFAEKFKNTDATTNRIFTYLTKVFSFKYSDEPDHSYEKMRDFNANGFEFKYTDSGNALTSYLGYGGYIIEFQDSYEEALKKVQELREADLLDYELRSMLIEFVEVNNNYHDVAIQSLLSFSVDGSGHVETEFHAYAVQYHEFSAFEFFLLTLFILFTIVYTFRVIRKMFRSWSRINQEWWSKRELKQEKNEDLKPQNRFQEFLQFIEMDIRIVKRNVVIIFFSTLIGLIIFLLKTVFKLLLVLYQNFTKSLPNAIRMTQMIIGFLVLLKWFEMMKIKQDFGVKYEHDRIIDFASLYLSKQRMFQVYATANTILTFMGILKFFSFSKKLSAFTQILTAAKYDVLVFIVMSSIVIFGFAIAGHAIYGAHLVEFSSVMLSSVTLLKFIGGQYLYSEMYEVAPSVSGLYFVSFLVLMRIAFLNMFIAIIVAHYNEFISEGKSIKSNQVQNELGFFQLVYSILKKHWLVPREKKVKSWIDLGEYFPNFRDQMHKWLFERRKKKKTEKQEDIEIEEEMQKNEAQKLRKMQERFAQKEIDTSQPIMKSYFDNTGTVEEQMSNIAIYRQIEKKSKRDTQDLVNSNFWLYTLEKQLEKISKGKIQFFEFKNEQDFFTCTYESFHMKTQNNFQKSFLVLQTFQDRAEFWFKYANTIQKKYQLIQALNFEKNVQIVWQNQNQKLLEMIDWINMQEEVPNKAMPNCGFKFFKNSAFQQDFEFNSVPSMTAYIWQTQLNLSEKYYLWFKKMTSIERIKLWNSLCFSDTYFKYILSQYGSYLKRFQSFHNQKSMKLRKAQAIQKKELQFTAQDIREFFKMFFKELDSVQGDKLNEIKQFEEIQRVIFKFMLRGLSQERYNQFKKLQEQGNQKNVYLKLVKEILDGEEERMQLWLPLSQEEKLDLILHQRDSIEAQVMIRLFHEEYWNIEDSLKYQYLDEKMERTLDNAVFTKYQSFTNLMTAKIRLKQSKKRLRDLDQEDLDIMNYIKFLVEKDDNLQKAIGHLKNEVEVLRRRNEKKWKQCGLLTESQWKKKQKEKQMQRFRQSQESKRKRTEMFQKEQLEQRVKAFSSEIKEESEESKGSHNKNGLRYRGQSSDEEQNEDEQEVSSGSGQNFFGQALKDQEMYAESSSTSSEESQRGPQKKEDTNKGQNSEFRKRMTFVQDSDPESQASVEESQVSENRSEQIESSEDGEEYEMREERRREYSSASNNMKGIQKLVDPRAFKK